jgi:hypothetical protein
MRRAWASCAFQLALFALALQARADGALVVGDRELLREGPARRGYCTDAGSGGDAECDRVLVKILSGYTYGRGSMAGGVVLEPEAGEANFAGVGALHVSVLSGDLPGGSIELGAVDGAFGGNATRALRVALLDAHSLFFCQDVQGGGIVAPIIAMLTTWCRPTAVFGLDAGLAAMQWDIATNRLIVEWLSVGPSFELLSNGYAYAHLLRSIGLALPFDVRSIHKDEQCGGNGNCSSLGAGLRLSTFYRSPQWEVRVQVRQRTALLGGGGLLHDNSVDGELRLLHNFFFSDAIALQLGVSLRGAWSQRPITTFVPWAVAGEHFDAFAGAYVGWVHEAPNI